MLKPYARTIALAFVAATLVSACSEYNREDDYIESEDNYGTIEAQRAPDSQTYSLELNRKESSQPASEGLFISEQGGYEVAKVEGIDAAWVMIADNNAYVAVVTNNTATGIFSNGSMDDDIDNAGESEGVYDVHSGKSTADPDLLVTDTNTYYTTTGHEPLSAKALQKIGSTVREVHPTVLQVYISSNRDFVNGMTQYMQEYWTGHSIEDRINSFNQMVERTFPMTGRQDD